MTTAVQVSERRIRVGMVLMGVSHGFLALVGLFLVTVFTASATSSSSDDPVGLMVWFAVVGVAGAAVVGAMAGTLVRGSRAEIGTPKAVSLAAISRRLVWAALIVVLLGLATGALWAFAGSGPTSTAFLYGLLAAMPCLMLLGSVLSIRWYFQYLVTGGNASSSATA